MPSSLSRRALIGLALLPLADCGRRGNLPVSTERYAGNTPEMQALVARYAAFLEIPPELLHHVIRVESGYNPAARNGPYYGLMQVNPQTARTMGYRGPDSGLLEETGLRRA